MKYWTYVITDADGKKVAEHAGKSYPKEQDARSAAAKVMKALLVNNEKMLNPFHRAVPPFVLELTVRDDSDLAVSQSVGMERYSEKEVREYGTGEDLSLGELLSIAKDNYTKGGDTVYECWDQQFYDDYVGISGPVKRQDTDWLFSMFRY